MTAALALAAARALPVSARISNIRYTPPKGLRRLSAVVTPPAPGADWTSRLVPALEQDILDETNAFRKSKGLGLLVFEPHLVASAEYAALFLANYGELEHDEEERPGHPALTFGQRLLAFGYHDGAGENAGYAWPDAAGMLSAFLSAGPGEGHYDDIVKPDWTACGMGCAISATGVHFWVQDFGVLPPTGPEPVITSISPSHGKAGDHVTVFGQHLTPVNRVTFTQNQAALINNASTGASVETVVPAAAVTGPIVITTPGGFAVSLEFTVDAVTTPPDPPPISKAPARGSKWVARRNPLAKPITVVLPVDGITVHAQNAKGKPLTPMPVAAFLKKYRPV